MSKKANQLLTGLIIFMIGAFTLVRPSFSAGVTSVTLLMLGFAFLLLYRTKRMVWSLVVGVYMIYFGIGSFLEPYTDGYFSLSFIGSMFFVVPALIFMALYFERKKTGLLIPSCLMLWFGLFIFVKNFYFLSGNTMMFFFICMALAFFSIFLLGRKRHGNWPLKTGLVLTLCGVFLFNGWSFASSVISNVPQIASAMLIAIAIVIIFKALKN